MIAEGADIIDVGAESTRPYGGAVRVTAAEELRRLAPVLAPIRALGIPVSVDTMKAEVATWAFDQGAAMVNDVWGLQRDPDMAAVVSENGMPVVLMHNRETADPALDIVADIEVFFARSLAIAEQAGIARDCIVLDPGIGFGKTAEQSIEAIGKLGRLKAFGLPLLVGASRKRFIDKLSPAPPDRRLGGSIAAHVMSVLNGAAIIRVHDVAETVQALKVAAAIRGHS
jgi:dihydropteroate synthase